MQTAKSIQYLHAYSSRRVRVPLSLSMRSIPTSSDDQINKNFTSRGFSGSAVKVGNHQSGVDQSKIKSNRALFKSIPVDGSILAYIRSIGVGLRSKKKKKKRNIPNKATKGLLSEEDEFSFFEGSEGRRFRKGKRRTQNTTTNHDNTMDNIDTNMASHAYFPPPPFVPFITDKEKDLTEDGNLIKRLPIKVLGSVGEEQEKMPRSSKGLPEIVSCIEHPWYHTHFNVASLFLMQLIFHLNSRFLMEGNRWTIQCGKVYVTECKSQSATIFNLYEGFST